ncbi:MAG: acyl-ACP--UDP-N-acetylglucosamine O-acyltransferase [Verrucomicrobiota bacterium]|nr:acyl-ACP--UDP-N-acetylglucosamine O-acyltransferase [Verrucomicrobiota bacterium]
MSNNKIHATAVIADSAKLGTDCVIGPYCVIGPDNILGDGVNLHSHVVIGANTTIGNNCEIYQFASIGEKTQDLKYKGEPTYTEIGDNNTIREYVTIHRGTGPGEKTIIGSSCTILAYCHIAHNCILGDKIIMSNGATLAGHVEVGDAAIVGGLTGIHQFVKIGTMAMVGGASKLVQDVLPFSIADGAPAVTRIINKIGLQRNNKDKDTIKTIHRAFKIIFKKDLKLEDAVKRLEEEFSESQEVAQILEFIAKSNRGLAR